MQIDVRRVGARAVRARIDPAVVEALRARLAAEPLAGQRELVAGGESVTVLFDGPGAAEAGAETLRAIAPPEALPLDGPLVEIAVVYDGEDLHELARTLGTDPDALVRMHTAREWHVGFLGFAPGFAYLRTAEPGPSIPRRAVPRTRVPAGSVALAGEYSAVYPRASPGGWQLIGRTDAVLWELDRDPPALLVPGTRVRFHAVRERLVVPETPAPPRGDPMPARGLLVGATGMQSLVEDLGRPGRAAIGVTRSGAADRGALRLANRLVGNPEGAAGVENAGGGLALTAEGEHVLAVAGGRAELTIAAPDGRWRTVDPGRPFALDDGEVLEIGPVTAGLRVVVAVRGGLAVPEVLGSRSTDTLARLGPQPLAPGAVLPVGPPPRAAVGAPGPLPAVPDGSVPTVLRVTPGPDADFFPGDAVDLLVGASWEVTTNSDRVGVRLTGARIERGDGEIRSQALVPGAIQVPPSGEPVVFLVDHPTTGGYPILAVVAEEHLDRLAQIPLGSVIRFAVS